MPSEPPNDSTDDDEPICPVRPCDLIAGHGGHHWHHGTWHGERITHVWGDDEPAPTDWDPYDAD